jgi:hypothetical protein
MEHPRQTSHQARQMIDSWSRWNVSQGSRAGLIDVRNDKEQGDNTDETGTPEKEHGIGDTEFWAGEHERSAVCGDETR